MKKRSPSSQSAELSVIRRLLRMKGTPGEDLAEMAWRPVPLESCTTPIDNHRPSLNSRSSGGSSSGVEHHLAKVGVAGSNPVSRSRMVHKPRMESHADAILIENLTKRFGDCEVLKELTLKIKEGEFYALMGPNGSGKTTLISIIASVDRPTTGKVEVYGREPAKAHDLIGYVPQENFSSPLLNGWENLVYFGRLRGFGGREAKRVAGNLLNRMGLAKEAKKRVSHYSGGMRKRLEVATGLLPGTRILILDEPTTGLDPSARRNFFGLLKDINDEGTAILLITHIGEDAESASRVGLIDNGMIVAEGEPGELKKKSGLKNVVNVETMAKSARIADALRRLSEEEKLLETPDGYRIYCEHPEVTIPLMVRALDEIGCKITRIEATRPSLEDVFFELTERPLGR